MDRKLTVVFGYAILVAWLVSFVVDIVVPTYDPPAAIHAALMVVVGALFGHSVLSRKDDKP